MAEYMLRTALRDAGISDVMVSSSGTSNGEVDKPIDPRAAAILQSHGINAEEHVAQLLTPEELTGMNLVLAMDEDHHHALEKMLQSIAPEQRPELRMMRSFDASLAKSTHEEQGIYDPWFGDSADFRLCWQMISSAIPGVLDYVRAHTMPSRGN